MSTSDRRASALTPVLLFIFANSLGTGMATQGVYFITGNVYGFTPVANFLLALLFGLTYIPAALFVAPTLRRLARRSERVTTRRVLGAMMVALALLCLIPPLGAVLGGASGPASMWVFVALYAPLNGALWPIAEAFVSGGRRGSALRSAAGRFNLAWSGSVAISVVALAPLFANAGENASALPLVAFVLLAGIHLACIVMLRRFEPEPGAHLASEHEAHTPDDEAMLGAFRVLLPVSFLVIAVLEPYLPFAIAHAGLPPGWQTPAAATWMAARFGVFLLLERWQAWHGRWMMPVVAALLTLVGLALALLAPRILEPPLATPVLLVGLAFLGTGLGAIYTGAFYYAMHVGGGAEIDAGGTHEAIIGIGYAGGPLLGLLAALIAGDADHEHIATPLVVLVTLLAGVTTGATLLLARRNARRASNRTRP